MKPDTRTRIIDSAIDTIAQNPLALLEEIADAARVGRATLYRYFPSRNDLIRHMILEASAKIRAKADPIYESDLSIEEKLRDLIAAVIPLGASLRFSVYFTLMRGDQDVEHIYEEYRGRLTTLCRELKAEGIAARHYPDAWMAACLDKLIFAAWEAIQKGDIAANDAADLVLETFFNGCVAN